LERYSGNALFAFDSGHGRINTQGFENSCRKMFKGPSLVIWRIVYTKQAQKDAKKIAASGLRPRAEQLIKILEKNPYQDSPPFKKLVGDLAGAYSRRINIQHRLVYEILDEIKTVKVIRMWTHYE
jgi:Txe/YoeB family toxin of toxin-antitoxin system